MSNYTPFGNNTEKPFEAQRIKEHVKAVKRAREEMELGSDDSRVFSTGSKRDKNDHKPRIADMKPYTRKRFGYHMLKGSKNYGIGNFELGQPTESSLESIHRHLADYELGDRSEDHLSAMKFGLQLIMLNEQKEGVPADFYYQKYLDEQKK